MRSKFGYTTLCEIHSAYVKIKKSDNSNEEKDVLSFIFLK